MKIKENKMKIKISGVQSKESILKTIAEQLTILEEKYDVKVYDGINFYFNVNEIIVSENFEVIKEIEVDKFCDNLGDTNVDFQSIEEVILLQKIKCNNSALKEKSEYDDFVKISREEYLKDKEIKRNELEKSLMEEKKYIEEKRNFEKQKEKNIENVKKIVMNQFEIEESVLPFYITSVAPIVDERYLKKNTPVKDMPKEGYVIRVTYRNEQTRKKDYSHYYNHQLELIGELKH